MLKKVSAILLRMFRQKNVSLKNILNKKKHLIKLIISWYIFLKKINFLANNTQVIKSYDIICKKLFY